MILGRISRRPENPHVFEDPLLCGFLIKGGSNIDTKNIEILI